MDPSSPIGQNMVQQKHHQKKQIDVAPQCMGKTVATSLHATISGEPPAKKEGTKLRRDERFRRMSQ